MEEDAYITIKEAADILGVSALTLRNWDKSGKFPARRHPMNNYRVYRLSEVEKLFNEIESAMNENVSSERREKLKKLKVRHIEEE